MEQKKLFSDGDQGQGESNTPEGGGNTPEVAGDKAEDSRDFDDRD